MPRGLELVFQEGQDRLAHGEGRGDAGEEQEAEPERACEGAEPPPLEEERGEREEPESEAAAAGGRRHHGAQSQVGGGDGDQDRPAEPHLHDLVEEAGRGAVQDDVLVAPDVGGVAVDRAHADGQGEEDLPHGGEPGAGLEEARSLWLVEELVAVHGALDHARVVRAQGEGADGQHQAEADQERHADLGRDLDPALEPAGEDPDVERQGEDEPEERLPRHGEDRIRLHPQVGGEELGGRLGAEGPLEGVPDVGQGPGLDVAVVGGHAEVGEQAEDAYVLEPPVAPQPVEHSRRRVVPELPAVAADRPLHPQERQPHEQESDQVRHQERPAAVLGRLGGEAQEVPQAHGVAGDGQDQPDPRAPLLLDAHCHRFAPFRPHGLRDPGRSRGVPRAERGGQADVCRLWMSYAGGASGRGRGSARTSWMRDTSRSAKAVKTPRGPRPRGGGGCGGAPRGRCPARCRGRGGRPGRGCRGRWR